MKYLLITLLIFSQAQAEFVDKLTESGIDFTHFNGMTGKLYFHEMMGGGVALLDYDNDGDLDIYFVQGNYINGQKDGLIFAPRHPEPLTDRLYRNDTTEADEPRFTDVTKQAGITASGYGMGVATGDIDNDGDVDIYLTNYGSNQLLLNNGDGTFSLQADAGGADDKRWSIGASFVDMDRDGWLDLYVVNYVNYKLASPKTCRAIDGTPDYCSPQAFNGVADGYFRNQGKGVFSNQGSRVGIAQRKAPGLGVISADFNQDGWPDIYVANDGEANILWMNQKNGSVQDRAMLSGVAVNMNGMPEASMGVDAADFDNDGDVDLFMTHLNRQTNTLYVNNGKGWFQDATVRMGLGSSSYKQTGFGAAWIDVDNDGLLDLFSANGGVVRDLKQTKAGEIYPMKQANQLWLNKGKGKYEDISAQQGAGFLRPDVSRGAAFGDIDNDGDIDIVVANNAGKPQLLINDINKKAKPANHWVGFAVKQANGKTDALGAVIEVALGDGRHLFKRVHTDGSYASARDPRVLFGLGKNAEPVKIIVHWPDGTTTRHGPFKIDLYHQINRKTSS